MKRKCRGGDGGGLSYCNTVELGTTFHHPCTWFSLFAPGHTAVHEVVICVLVASTQKAPALTSILKWAHAYAPFG